MAVLKNRAKMSTSSTGTGTITLGSAETGYQSFADAGVANSDQVRYVIEDSNDWEIGTGTYTSSGTTLSRIVSESSNSGSALNLSGSATVFITAAAEDLPNLYADNPVSAVAPTASGNNAVAIGEESTASGTGSISLGSKSDATQTESTALGYFAQATGSSATALGNRSNASNSHAIAIGLNTDATSISSLAIGYAAQAVTGSGATAISNSYASGADSFAAVIGNNGSSYGATGNYSVAIGNLAKATGNYAVALNYAAIASGAGAVSTGQNSNASASYSTVIGGRYGEANEKSKVTFGGANWLNDGGTVNLAHQTGLFNLAGFTTDGTAKALTTYDSTASSDNQVILPNNSAFTFTGTIIARKKASEGSDYSSWEIKGALLRDANAGSTVLGNGIVNSLYHTSGASAWAIALSADTTNGGLKVQVTGAASTNIRWAATVNTSEVIYA